ncbi:hypothetical protein QZH41_003818 [Actinostola sp. cb2023]|nr:hypothetical protein QZH41_003818 [Actinostola sp. cb2023]
MRILGHLKPGGTIVEGTAGNTGIGLAHICLAKGYQCIIYMPDNQAKEKTDLLQALGADVRLVPVVPFDNPLNYNHQARRFAESLDTAVWTNQFDNTANRRAHFETTGPEIWQQTDGQVDAVVFSTGTGGTIAGVGSYLKSKNPNVKVFLADPQGSVLYNYFKIGNMVRTEGNSITEGIGQGRVTTNLQGAPIDDAVFVHDTEAIEMVAKLLGPGHTITTCLCDSGQRPESLE